MAVGDFNADGFDEVVGGGGQGKMAQYIFRYVPSSGMWDQIELDIVTIGGSPTNNVVWYQNSR